LSPPVDVLIVGAGPAGVATAIAAAQRGLRAMVVDARRPPIDKACGEGLLPEAVASLRSLGIGVRPPEAFPFSGIRFTDGISSCNAAIARGEAFGLRRILLQQLLMERAENLGVAFQYGIPLKQFEGDRARIGNDWVGFRWVVGADGQNSNVRRWAGLNPRRRFRSRFGFRQHFRARPWTNFVEAHWGEGVEMILTPTGENEICISLMTSDPHLRIGKALEEFPEVRERLRGAGPATTEIGAPTALGRARAATRGNVALVGDASCALDGVSGQGLSLAFQEAAALGEALAREDLRGYEEAHRKMTHRAMRMTRLMLLMDQCPRIRRKALRLFAANPAMFAKMIAVHMGKRGEEELSAGELVGLGWEVLRT
jgi:menaquinone-9 beta-reductase